LPMRSELALHKPTHYIQRSSGHPPDSHTGYGFVVDTMVGRARAPERPGRPTRLPLQRQCANSTRLRRDRDFCAPSYSRNGGCGFESAQCRPTGSAGNFRCRKGLGLAAHGRRTRRDLTPCLAERSQRRVARSQGIGSGNRRGRRGTRPIDRRCEARGHNLAATRPL
jgi:hypothetical protein